LKIGMELGENPRRSCGALTGSGVPVGPVRLSQGKPSHLGGGLRAALLMRRLNAVRRETAAASSVLKAAFLLNERPHRG